MGTRTFEGEAETTLDLGGLVEDSIAVCSTFVLIPKSPNCRLVRRVFSFVPLVGDVIDTSAVFVLHK